MHGSGAAECRTQKMRRPKPIAQGRDHHRYLRAVCQLFRNFRLLRPVWCGRYRGRSQGLGSTYSGRSAGSGASAAIFSFNGNKIITTSGGGMLVSDNRDFIDRARFLAQQARDPEPHYEHSEIGYNYRMSNILAAVGRGQLRVLKERVKRKRAIFQTYFEKLNHVPGILFMPEALQVKSNRWLTVILITPEEFGASSDEVRLALEADNIDLAAGLETDAFTGGF